jgi:hypothetical protein
MKQVLLITSSFALAVSTVGAAFSLMSGRADLFIFAIGLGIATVATVEVSK